MDPSSHTNCSVLDSTVHCPSYPDGCCEASAHKWHLVYLVAYKLSNTLSLRLFLCYLLILGKNDSDSSATIRKVDQLEQVVTGRNTSLASTAGACVDAPTFGSLFMGANTFQDVFEGLRFVFRVGVDGEILPKPTESEASMPKVYRNENRVPWKKLPGVDLLLVRQPSSPRLRSRWMEQFVTDQKAHTLVIFHHQDEIIGNDSLSFHSVSKRLKSCGYQVRSWTARAEACGAAIWNHHLITVATLNKKAAQDLPNVLGIDLPPRPCRNALQDFKIRKSAFTVLPASFTPVKGTHPVYSNFLGIFRGSPVYDIDGPFGGDNPKSWIYNSKWNAVRHLTPEEWRKLKGCDGPFGSLDQCKLATLADGIESHVLSVLGEILSPCLAPSERPSSSGPAQSPLDLSAPVPALSQDTCQNNTPKEEWSWTPPDLRVGSEFYVSTVSRLRTACDTLPESEREQAFLDGLDDLDAHRGNYSGDGPTKLTLLWWEWPEEHWESIRLGISMNFMRVPEPNILPNMDMDAEQLDLANKFVDQLISLGVLRSAKEDGVEVVNNFPLFLVPKSGQPGEWRCIADGKSGGQNACCISDPCMMTAPDHILPFLYRGGFSAVADFSKYFHCFKTQIGEYMYFGLIHPVTGEVLYYARLPMGTCNSPAGSGRLGAALIRELIDNCALFQGVVIDNTKIAMVKNLPFHPQWGEGRVLIGEDGLPALLIRLHIDDTFLHGPTYDKTAAGLTALLDSLLRKGLVCQHIKTEPPSQLVKYCGFLYDTRGDIPTLRIPDDKVSRAIALVHYLRRGTRRCIARLVGAKVIGFLQSLVPATQSNIGNSFLRSLYSDLHSLKDENLIGTTAYYFTPLDLSATSNLELAWWDVALSQGLLSRQSQMPDMGTLGVKWGDGSGTGTGGTFNWVSVDTDTRLAELETWMGVWNGIVHRFSSNWKELRTLVISLQRLRKSDKPVSGRVFWYLTDNQVTYDICRSSSSSSIELHKLVREVRLLELEMGIRVEVIHVPGVLMIRQGTDGLSRGIVMPSFARSNGVLPLLDIFRPAEPSAALLSWVFSVAQVPHQLQTLDWLFREDLDDWSRTPLLHRFTLWCPSPQFGRQCILEALLAWVEAPFDSGHLFIIPRIMQRDFGRMAKFVKFIGVFWDLPLSFVPVVPFLVFYLPPFDRLQAYLEKTNSDFTPHRMESSPPARAPHWVRQQLEEMQWL